MQSDLFKVGVFFNGENPTGCDYYRSILPVKHLKDPLLQRGIEISLLDNVYTNMNMDAYVVHRQIGDEFIRALACLAEQGKAIVWDHDDLLTEIPSYNPVRVSWTELMAQRWQAIKHIATATTTTTENLARASFSKEKLTSNTVLPNLIDLNDYNPQRKNRDKIRILWAGSETHSGDLDLIVNPLRRIIDRYREQVEIVFFGYAPNDLVSTNLTDIHIYPQCPVNFYPKMLSNIAPDIGLCPLLDNKFNRCKSNCKAIEMTAAGAVTISQKGVAYDHRCSWAVASDENDWYSSIKTVIEELAAIREDINYKEHRTRVLNDYSWQFSRSKKDWINFFVNLKEKRI